VIALNIHRDFFFALKTASFFVVMSIIASGCGSIKVQTNPPGAKVYGRKAEQWNSGPFSAAAPMYSQPKLIGLSPTKIVGNTINHYMVKVVWDDGVSSDWRYGNDNSALGVLHPAIRFDFKHDEFKDKGYWPALSYNHTAADVSLITPEETGEYSIVEADIGVRITKVDYNRIYNQFIGTPPRKIHVKQGKRVIDVYYSSNMHSGYLHTFELELKPGQHYKLSFESNSTERWKAIEISEVD
jgi:hypothetical protein